MLDVIIRALKHPQDYLPVIHKRTLTFKEPIAESNEIYSFIFTFKEPFTWKAGQHGIFYFPHTNVQGKWWRAFSIASSSDENVIRISTIIKENPSDFKKHLLELKAGDTFIMRGPFGEFYTNANINHIVGIAGGIGITPFRAIIKDIAGGKIENTKLTLIYSAVGTHTYKQEFDFLAQHPSIVIVYTQTPDEVNQNLKTQIQNNGNSASYFISGSPGMITAIRETLKENGITHIVNDSFKGY